MTSVAEPEQDWSWHDDLIHGLHLRPPDADRQLWRSELVLDIDHTVEWLPPENGWIKRRVAPATLVFDWVRKLRVAVDFSEDMLGGAVTQWSIHFVEKTPVASDPGYRGDPEYQWRIVLNEPHGGEIAFIANGYVLLLRADAQIDADPATRPPIVLPPYRGRWAGQ